MKRTRRCLFFLWVVLEVVCMMALGLGWLAAASGSGDEPRTPVVVELFTSEGCSSCPAADRVLSSLYKNQPLAGVEIIALSEHVDYWDRLGWKDPFSKPKFTDRQRRYARKLSLNQVYTPQIIVDGRADVVGSNEQLVRLEIERAAEKEKGRISIEEVPPKDSSRPQNSHVFRVQLKAAPQWAMGKGDVFVAVTEDGLRSRVSRGENRGRKLDHDAVVRAIDRVAEWDLKGPFPLRWEGRVPLSRDWSGSLRVIVFVQDEWGRIPAADSLAFPR